MVENHEHYLDVLTQISAVTKELESVPLSFLDEHLKHCVAEAIAEAKVGEASDAR